MTVTGKVLNLDDFTEGLYFGGGPTAPLIPNSVQLAQAILCDDMHALAGVQLSPTDRSVARSCAATLTKLCQAGHLFPFVLSVDSHDVGHTTGVSDGVYDGVHENSEKGHEAVMHWLTLPPAQTPTRHVSTLTETKSYYTNAFERKIKAFDDALDRAAKDPVNREGRVFARRPECEERVLTLTSLTMVLARKMDLDRKVEEMNAARGRSTTYFCELDKSNIVKVNEVSTVAQATLLPTIVRSSGNRLKQTKPGYCLRGTIRRARNP